VTVEQVHVLSMTAIAPALPNINERIEFPITNILILSLLKSAWIVCKSVSEREGE